MISGLDLPPDVRSPMDA